jgi:hypothetical protein
LRAPFLENAMGLWDLNKTDSDESDSAVSDGEEQIPIVHSTKPIAPDPEPTTDTLSTETKDTADVKMQETSHKEKDEVSDDVEDEEEYELPLRRPKKVVKETAEPTAAAAASTKAKAKDVEMEMEGSFNKYGKWKREELEKDAPCTLTFGCILEARHPRICICPFDQSRDRKCKPTSFAPPTRRVERPKKRAKTETVVLAAVEIPASAPQVEAPSSDDEDRIVASLVSLKKGPATSSSVMTIRTESTGLSSAGPSTVTTEDNIKELAKLLASLPDEDSKIALELELMHAIAKKYQLQPGNVAK